MNIWNGIRAVSIKEARHIWRDKRSMLILFALPALIVGIFGFVLSFEIHRVPVAVLNLDKGVVSKRLIHAIDVSDTYHVIRELNHSGQIAPAFGVNQLRMVVVIPEHFSQSIAKDHVLPLRIFIDGSHTKVATALEGSLRQLAERFMLGLLPPGTDLRPKPLVHFAYNNTLKKEVMPIPGLIMIIFILISSIMLSVSMNKEKEQGSYRLLQLTPAGPGSIILGKTLPYLVISIVHIASVWMLSRGLFQISIAGSGMLFFLLCLTFALNSMAFGLLVASLAQRQLEALIICWIFLFLPNVFLSGFIFPVNTMTYWLQDIAELLPGTAFISAYRGIVLRGTGLEENLGHFAWLIGQGGIIAWFSLLCTYRPQKQ